MSKSKGKKEISCIFFVEGKTEYHFHTALLRVLKNYYPGKRCRKFKIYDLKGIGKFQSKALGKFRNDAKNRFGDMEYHVFLCYDSDVFDYNIKPPVNWTKLEKELKNEGADKITHIIAEKMIEDWLLIDLAGIVRNLEIKTPAKLIGKNGYEKIKRLFRYSNKIYIKGENTNNLINSLDIKKIYNAKLSVFKDLEGSLF